MEVFGIPHIPIFGAARGMCECPNEGICGALRGGEEGLHDFSLVPSATSFGGTPV